METLHCKSPRLSSILLNVTLFEQFSSGKALTLKMQKTFLFDLKTIKLLSHVDVVWTICIIMHKCNHPFLEDLKAST